MIFDDEPPPPEEDVLAEEEVLVVVDTVRLPAELAEAQKVIR